MFRCDIKTNMQVERTKVSSSLFIPLVAKGHCNLSYLKPELPIAVKDHLSLTPSLRIMLKRRANNRDLEDTQ